MRAGLHFVLLSTLALALASFAGELRVSGPLSGTWTSGTDVFVEDESYVPEGESLIIENNVVVTMKTTARFSVYGLLEIRGTNQLPVLLRTEDANWEGIFFSPNDNGWQRLSYVFMLDSDPRAERVIVSEAANLELNSCQFYGRRSALEVMNGRIQADANKFISTGMYSRAALVRHLMNQIDDACDSPNGNKLTNNLISAIVPEADSLDEGLPRAFTAGLFIDGSTSLCLAGNVITVSAPRTVIAAYFGETADQGSPLAILDYSAVTARSYSGIQTGIYEANEGALRVIHCTIDVSRHNPESPYVAAGVVASHDADVLINSSILELDVGDQFFVSQSGGLLSVDYTTRWSNTGFSGQAMPPNHGSPSEIQDDENPNVLFGDHNIAANPMLARNGIWGEWTTLQEVQSYYSLLPGSPCIDTGDTLFGFDQNNSLPDHGRYPYEVMMAEEPGRSPGMLREFSLGKAYPNPFNPNTTVPFSLLRPGRVQIEITDVLGRTVEFVELGSLSAGPHDWTWDASDLTTGTYFLRALHDGLPAATLRIVLLK